jgi:DeoR family transcriptional regulator, ulaG and ulaABCDEF operon transcriptional repressor
VMLPGGSVYRDQSIILSPFDNDVTRNFYARRMFMGAQGIGPLGVMEQDALIIQAEQKLINQADELVLLVDSTKFQRRSSLILCALDRVSTLVTDDAIPDAARTMVEDAGIKLIVAKTAATDRVEEASSVA